MSLLLFFPKVVKAEIAQLGERQTEDLKVPGSNPENSLEFWIIPGLGKVFSFPVSDLLFLFSLFIELDYFPTRFSLNFRRILF